MKPNVLMSLAWLCGAGIAAVAVPTAANSSNVVTAEAQRGGSVTFAEPASPANFDSQLSFSGGVHVVASPTMQPLLRYQPVSIDDSGVMSASSTELEGVLAESWENPEPLVWWFTIAAGATWQDRPPVDGRPVVADDVVATFERLLDEDVASPLYKYYAPFVDSVEAVDERVVQFNMKVEYLPLPNVLAAGYTEIFPREGIEGEYDLETEMIGSGPFELAEYELDQFYRFERNDSYWQNGLPYLDEVVIRIMPDPTVQLNALLAGELDATSVTGENLPVLDRSQSDLAVMSFTPMSSLGLHIVPSPENAPFDDPRVREAVRLAVDQDQLIATAWGGNASFTGITGPFSAWALTEEENRELWHTDRDRARDLLAEAGYPNGFTTQLNWCTCHQQNIRPFEQIAQVLVSQLAEVGITLELVPRENAAHHELLFSFGHEGLILNGQGTFLGDDPQSWLYDHFSVNGGFNWAQPPDFADPELQRMLDEQYQMSDVEARLALSHEIERYVAGLSIWVGVGIGVENEVWDSELHDYSVRIGPPNLHLEATWIDGD